MPPLSYRYATFSAENLEFTVFQEIEGQRANDLGNFDVLAQKHRVSSSKMLLINKEGLPAWGNAQPVMKEAFQRYQNWNRTGVDIPWVYDSVELAG